MADSAMETFSGGRVEFNAPKKSRFTLADIAHSLSQQCRFLGHTRVPYSVLDHSMLVFTALRRITLAPEFGLAALLHDASEAFIADLPSPLKHLPGMEAYRDMDKALQEVIVDQLLVDRELRLLVTMAVKSPLIKALDCAVTLTERDALLNHDPSFIWEYDGLYPSLDPAVRRWSKDEFIDQFNLLVAQWQTRK